MLTDMRVRGLKPSTNWSFPAIPQSNWTLQGILNNCTYVSGTRYLIPPELASGLVIFGHTNAMNGPEYIAAVEDVLKQNGVGRWDRSSKILRMHRLSFLPFPEQKVIVVLLEAEVVNFLRANGINPHQFSEAR